MPEERDINKQPVHLRKFDGRLHMTARFMRARCRIPQDLFDLALTAVEIDGGQGALSDGTDQWVDAYLFFELATSPLLSGLISDAKRDSILLMLGHFDMQEQSA